MGLGFRVAGVGHLITGHKESSVEKARDF